MAVFASIIGAIGGAIGLTGGVLATFTAIGVFALKMMVGLGLSLALSMLAGKPKQQPFGVQGKLSSGADVSRSILFGLACTAGSLLYANSWGQDGKSPNAYFTQVIQLADYPVQTLEDVWINNEYGDFADTPHPQYGYPVLQYRKGGKDHLWIKFYDGWQGAADSFVVNTASQGGIPYSVNRIGFGCPYVVMTSLVNQELFTGFPQAKFVVTGAALYDPSKDDTVGGVGDHRYDDYTTWGGDGDHLPAVQLYNICRGIYWNDQWLYGLQNMTSYRLPPSNWIPQINKCRMEVAGPDGIPEPQYRSGLEIQVGANISDAIEALLTAMQGRLCEIAGTYKLYCGAPDSPVFSFHDNDIITTEEQSFTPFFTLADSVNGIKGSYPNPGEAWATKVPTPLYRTDLELRDGKRRLMADVSFNAVPYDAQVQRLMHSAIAEAQRARRHTHTMPPKFWFVEPGDIGEWTSPRNGYIDKLFRVDGAIDKANLDVTLDMTEVDPDDFDIPTYEELPDSPTAPIRPPPQPVVDWFAEGIILQDPITSRKRPGINLSWDGTQEDVDFVRYWIRLKADGSPVHNGSTHNVLQGNTQISQGLIPDTEYEVQAQYGSFSGREFLPTAWLTVRTPEAQLIGGDIGPGIITLPKFGADAQKLLDERKQSILGMFNEALTRQIEQRKYEIKTANALASFTETIDLIITDQDALADALTEVIAQFNDATAETTFRMTSVSGIPGVAARIAMQARVGKTGTTGETTWVPAGFFIDVLETSPGSDTYTGRITMLADTIEFRSSADILMMYFDAIKGRLTLDTVVVRNAEIQGEIINDAGVKVSARFRFGNRLYGETWTRRVGRGWTIGGSPRSVLPQLRYTEDNRIEAWTGQALLGSYAISPETVWPWSTDYIEVINPVNQGFTRLWPDGQIEIGDYDGGGNWVVLVAKSPAFRNYEMDPFNIQQATSFIFDTSGFACVPEGVTTCTAKGWGAGGWGGDGASGGRGFGGAGGYGKCDFPVTPGELIRVTIPQDATQFARIHGPPIYNTITNSGSAAYINLSGQPFSSMTGFGGYGVGRATGGSRKRYEMATPGGGAVVISRGAPQLGDESIVCVFPGGGSALGPYHGFPGGDPTGSGGNVGTMYGVKGRVVSPAVYTGGGGGYEGGGYAPDAGSFGDASQSYRGYGGTFFFAPQCTNITQMAQTYGSTEFPPNASDADWIALGSVYGKGGWSNISGTVPAGQQGVALLTFT